MYEAIKDYWPVAVLVIGQIAGAAKWLWQISSDVKYIKRSVQNERSANLDYKKSTDGRLMRIEHKIFPHGINGR